MSHSSGLTDLYGLCCLPRQGCRPVRPQGVGHHLAQQRKTTHDQEVVAGAGSEVAGTLS
jgi:hypothetical protein